MIATTENAMMPSAIGVDRKAGIVRGVVVAQAHDFRNQARGRFNERSLHKLVDLAAKQPRGLISNFQHHSDPADDGLGSYLGRFKNFRLDTALWREDDGSTTTTRAVRADLFVDSAAYSSPLGNVAGYTMQRLQNDPESLATSLRLRPDVAFELDSNKRPVRNAKGEVRGPVWTPEQLLSADFVAAGEAVSSALSARALCPFEVGKRLRRIAEWEGRTPRWGSEYANDVWLEREAEWRKEYLRNLTAEYRQATKSEGEWLDCLGVVALTYRPR